MSSFGERYYCNSLPFIGHNESPDIYDAYRDALAVLNGSGARFSQSSRGDRRIRLFAFPRTEIVINHGLQTITGV